MQLSTATQTMCAPTWENRRSCTWIYHCQNVTDSQNHWTSQAGRDIKGSWSTTPCSPQNYIKINILVVEMPQKSVRCGKRNIPSPYQEGENGCVVDCLSLNVSVLLLSPSPVHNFFPCSLSLVTEVKSLQSEI